MTTTVRITFEDDDEAQHFAAMLKASRGVVYRPHHAAPDSDPSQDEPWPEPQSVKTVHVERKPEEPAA